VKTGLISGRPRTRERGSILIFAALVMMVLFGFMGLSLDVSYLYFHRRRMQTAADAAAIAAAQELLRGNASAVTASAQNDSALNGFTNGSDRITVAVSRPPVHSAHAGNNQFVEVTVSQPQTTWFLHAVGASNITVTAHSVAGLGGADACVYALNRDTGNPNNGFFVNGTTNSTFNCGVYSNAHFRSVGGACVVATNVSYTGDYTNSSNCTQMHDRGVPVVDPMAGRFTMPATSPCDYTNYKKTNGPAVVLTPGVYCGGIDIGGSVPSATFAAGTYVLVGGGLKLRAGVTVFGTETTFFNTFPGTNSNQYGPISINGTGTVNLTAPVSGAYKALLFYQDPRVPWAANNGSTIAGGANSVFQGIVYLPTTDLQYSGNSINNGSGSGYTLLVGYNIKVNGRAQVNADFSAIGGVNPLQKAVLAE
jgi:Flp pilus assembly protein TadG